VTLTRARAIQAPFHASPVALVVSVVILPAHPAQPPVEPGEVVRHRRADRARPALEEADDLGGLERGVGLQDQGGAAVET